MEIDKKTYEILTYKANDIKEGILALTSVELKENVATDLKEDLIRQLEELKLVLKEM